MDGSCEYYNQDGCQLNCLHEFLLKKPANPLIQDQK